MIFEMKVEKILIVIIVIKRVILDSFIVNILCVMWLVIKKFIVEEKEVLFVFIDIKLVKSSYEYEFGGVFGVFVMMIVLLVVVVGFFLFCNDKFCLVCEV